MRKETYTNIAKIIAFLTILVILLNLLSAIFIPKQITSNAKYKGIISHIDSFYEEPGDTLDVIFLGSSHIFQAISPLEIWNDYGITGYDVTSSSQCAYKSYHFLQDIFKYQSPEIVVFDLMSLFIDESIDEISNRSALNYMKFSTNYLTTVHHSLNRKNNETMASYIFPILRYHSRWEELSPVDFNIAVQRDRAKGFDMRSGAMCKVKLKAEDFPFFTQTPTEKAAGIVENSAGYIRDMVDLCEDNGAELVFIKTPVANYTYEMGNAMKKFADECGVTLIDYNQKWKELGLDYTADFLDPVHLNLNGAKKLSKSLGNILSTKFKLADHREDEEYEIWNEDYKMYEAEKEAKQLQNCNDISAYRDLIKKDDYVIMYSGNITNIDDSFKTQLGLRPIKEGTVQYGVIENGNREKAVHHIGTGKTRYDIDNVRCEIGTADGYKIRFLGENVTQGDEGFYLVVFDRRLKLAADVIKISTGKISEHLDEMLM